MYKIIPGSVMADQYKIMECATYMVPVYDPKASPFDYLEPSQPALTKHGWLKMQVIGMQFADNDVRMLGSHLF